ncbi:MAG TPA: TonB family protein [Bryobacteraceae bacterium]|nr:TonB family protein [Bryobacteraceae bacterium]HOQ47374.1 TonB family protein [Bryobacteraceae bacterium]HPU73497.1 TonB family protein [Bryobacteraceae bacterium]
MTNSSVPAETLGSPSPVSASYLWEAPNQAVSIQISLDVIDRIEREVIDSFKAITKRGSEVGGILLGRIAHAGKRTVFVENYESVPCDYARGPLYLLAEADIERLRETLQRLKGSPLSVVGFFRSNTRKELVLDEDDLALAQEFFSDPNQVFLLVKPFAMKPSQGAFFLWEDGRLQTESPLQFPFRRSELQKTPQAIVQAGGRAGDAAPPAPAREDRAPVVFPKREERAAAPVFIKREEPRLGPVVVPPKREGPVVATPPPRQDLPPVRVAAPPPAVSKREEPASPEASAAAPVVPKREERPPVPLTFKREQRPAIVPVPKREERPAPVLPKREQRPPITPVSLKREEKPAVAPKQEEPPKSEERPAVQPAAKREEAAPPLPPVAKAEKKEEPAAASSTSQATVEPAAAAKTDEPIAVPFLAEEPAKRSAGRWVAIILIVLLAVAAGVYFGLIRGRQAPPPPVDTALNLRVERNAGQLVLTWNRNAPIIANSQKSTLSITDGEHQEDVELDPGTLRSGSIVYSPITNDVSFRLEVNGQDGTPVSESVRALAGRPSPLQNMPPPAVSETRTQPAATTPAATPAAPQQPPATTQSSSAGQAQPQATVAQTQPPPEDEEEPPVQTRVTAAPPKPFSLAARLRPAQPAELAAPPQIQGGSTPSGIAARLLPGQSTAVPPPPAPPPAPEPKPVVGGVVQEPVLLERVQPVYPPLARQARIAGVVRVEALVGADGRVLRATAVSGPPLLRQSAVEAVQRWRYRPATLNGKPVEVTTQVDISFTLNR